MTPRPTDRCELLPRLLALLACLAAPAAAAQPAPPTATATPHGATTTATPRATTATAIPDAARAAFGDTAARERLLGRGRAALAEVQQQIERLEAALARLREIEQRLAPRRARTRRERLALPWYEDPLARAEARLAAGDPLGALTLLDAVSALDPPPRARSRVTELRLRAHRDYLRLALVEARLGSSTSRPEPDRPLLLVLELHSRSSEPLTLRDKEQTRWPGRLEIEVLVADPAGTIFRHRTVRRLAVEVPETLAKGKPWRTTITAQPPADDFGPRVLRRVSVRGVLQPGQIRRGDETVGGAVLLPPLTLEVAAPDAPGADAPGLATTRQALAAIRAAGSSEERLTAERTLFYAATLAPENERGAITRLLFPVALRSERDEPAAAIARTTLRVLTDHPELRDRRDWLRHGLRAIGASEDEIEIDPAALEPARR